MIRPDLPWSDPDFQVSGGLVALYLVWSATESSLRRAVLCAPVLGMYATLLVSVLDSFLIRATPFATILGSELWPVRWAGLVLFGVGSALRIATVARGPGSLLRAGRALQLAGLPLALGSVAGAVVGLLPAMMTVPLEKLEEAPGVGVESDGDGVEDRA